VERGLADRRLVLGRFVIVLFSILLYTVQYISFSTTVQYDPFIINDRKTVALPSAYFLDETILILRS
jgi:hypothetical protein